MTLRSILLPARALATAMVLLAALVLVAAPQAMAQTAPAAEKPENAAPGGAKMKDRVEKRIAELHEQLKITPAQEPAWNELATTMREDAAAKMATYKKWSQEQGKMNALELLQAHATLADENAQHLHKLVAAFEKLYNMMPDEQKKNADEVFSYRMAKAKAHAKARKMENKMNKDMNEKMDN